MGAGAGACCSWSLCLGDRPATLMDGPSSSDVDASSSDAGPQPSEPSSGAGPPGSGSSAASDIIRRGPPSRTLDPAHLYLQYRTGPFFSYDSTIAWPAGGLYEFEGP